MTDSLQSGAALGSSRSDSGHLAAHQHHRRRDSPPRHHADARPTPRCRSPAATRVRRRQHRDRAGPRSRSSTRAARPADAPRCTASGLIGFAGIMLGLLFTSDVATSYGAWPLSLSAALLAGSVLPLAYALVPRAYTFDPNIGSLDDLFAAAPAGWTQAAAVKGIRRSIDRNAFFVDRKTRAVRTGMTMIAGAVAIIGVSGVYHRERAQRVPARSHPVSFAKAGAVVSAPRRRMGDRNAVERGGDTRRTRVDIRRHRCRSRGARRGDSHRRDRQEAGTQGRQPPAGLTPG